LKRPEVAVAEKGREPVTKKGNLHHDDWLNSGVVTTEMN